MEKVTTKRQGKQTAAAAEATKRKIIQCATELFACKGFENASLREIAHAAHISHGTLRHHFGSKMSVWSAVLESVLEEYGQRMWPIIRAAELSDQPLQAFRSVVRGFIEVSLDNPTFAQLFVRESAEADQRHQIFMTFFAGMHQGIEPLFLKAKAQSKSLAHFNNDTFFLSLLSLTFFPLSISGIQAALPGAHLEQKQDRIEFLLRLMFAERSE